MRVHSKMICWAAIGSALVLSGCGSTGVFSSPVYIAVTISPRVSTVPQGGTVVFSATVSNNLSTPQFTLLAAADTASAGTLTLISGSPNSILYTAPSAPPIYNSGAPAGITQGSVTLDAGTIPPPQNTAPVFDDEVSFIITAPTITLTLNPDTVAVPLGTTTQFSGYEVGSANTGLNWYVNGVLGGIPLTTPGSAGTISSSGLYAAPATLPMTGSAVTITLAPQANLTQTVSSFVTLQ